VLGICRKQLKRALFLDYLLRFHRERRGMHVVEMTNGVVQEAVNDYRHNGMDSILHSCTDHGPEHVTKDRRLKEMPPDQVCVCDFFPIGF
jgi:hypothetical protein